jgi:hypothetical protein
LGKISDINSIKNRFQSIFQNPEIFDLMWDNTALNSSLWNGLSKNQAKMVFDNWVTTKDNILFNFIKNE